jgi:hypothetical protein
LVANWLHVPELLVLTALFPVAIVVVIWHTGSTFPLRARFWRLLISSPDPSEGLVRDLVRERENLVKFRYIFGIRAQTLNDVERLKQWSHANDADLSAIAACGSHFDVRTCKVTSPSVARGFGLFVLVAAFYLGAVASGDVAIKHEALVSLEGSSRWFWLTSSKAVEVESPLWRWLTSNEAAPKQYTLVDCQEFETAQGLNTTGDEGRLCAGFRKGAELNDFIQDGVKKQRYFFGSFGLAFLSLAIATLRGLNRVGAARHFSKRFHGSTADPSKTGWVVVMRGQFQDLKAKLSREPTRRAAALQPTRSSELDTDEARPGVS